MNDLNPTQTSFITQSLQRLDTVAQFAKAAKWHRFWHNPLKYITALGWNHFIFRLSRRGLTRTCNTFFDHPFTVVLPAGTDIYLSGAKTHPSEIRLAKWILKHLQPQEVFWDIGAHFGFFSTLAARIVGKEGLVLAFEPTPQSRNCLQINAKHFQQIDVRPLALSNREGQVNYHCYPWLYGEYNGFQAHPELETQGISPIVIPVQTTTLDTLSSQERRQPSIIKLDVEGAENLVIEGGKHLLTVSKPWIVMEVFHQPKYQAVVEQLQSYGYAPYLIDNQGNTHLSDNWWSQCSAHDSDNVVFMPV